MAYTGTNQSRGTRAMLEVVRSEKASLQQRLKALDEREETILQWIAEEEGSTVQVGQQELIPLRKKPVLRHRGKPTLTEFFKDVIRDGKPRTNAELAELAINRGIVDTGVDMRSVNSTMLALSNSGVVERAGSTWKST